MSSCLARVARERGELSAAGRLHELMEALGAFAEPEESFAVNTVVLGVARLHVGLDQGVEPSALSRLLARPSFYQAPVLLFSERAQELDIVRRRGEIGRAHV